MAGKREIVCILAGQGKKTKEIAAITGLCTRTVNQYKSDMVNQQKKRTTKEKMDLSMKIEWTEAVNRLRKAFGKELFPIP